MAISEVAVKDAELLAIKELHDAGGVVGRTLEPVIEDGASDWPTFADKARKLINEDEVAVTFGGWTSASRKAMLPVFEGAHALLWYPVQYEGLEASPYIFYTGAAPNQQIVPALDCLREQGLKKVFLLGSDYGDSNVAFFKQLRDAGITAVDTPTMSVSVAEQGDRGDRRGQHGRAPGGLELLPDHEDPPQCRVRHRTSQSIRGHQAHRRPD
jgi:ABC-type branched-subunit amino acid transport system substrate-binding protein